MLEKTKEKLVPIGKAHPKMIWIITVICTLAVVWDVLMEAARATFSKLWQEILPKAAARMIAWGCTAWAVARKWCRPLYPCATKRISRRVESFKANLSEFRKHTFQRATAIMLAFMMIFSTLTPTTFAAENTTADSAIGVSNVIDGGTPTPCENHMEHDADCGFSVAVAGTDCTHAHDDTCGCAEAIPSIDCG